jgi:SAM-dependent methyltransferase
MTQQVEQPSRQKDQYSPQSFWEEKHREVNQGDVKLGVGIQYVGGGQCEAETKALYQLRQLALQRTLGKVTGEIKSIFELGSGGGFWANYFQRREIQNYFGSDISSTTVERLKEQFPKYTFACAEDTKSFWQSVVGKAPFDLCLAFDVLYHITNDADWEAALDGLCRATKSKGYLLIVDYFFSQVSEHASKCHVKHRPMQQYLDLLDKHGFDIVHIQPVFYLHNRITGGPWQDQNRVLSRFLRACCSNYFGITLLTWVDYLATAVIHPMNPRSKARILLARKD